jgi:glycosyltransferase involved in cell wall biosynthesis
LSDLAVFSLEYSEAQPIEGVKIWSSEKVKKEDRIVTDRKYIKEVIINDAEPYYQRYNKSVASKLKKLIDDFQPEIIIFSKLPQTAYLSMVESLSSAHLILDLDESSSQVRKSISSIITHPVSKLVNIKIFDSICRYESSTLPKFNKIWVSSDLEVKRLKEQYGHDLPVSNIPNSINLEIYVSNFEIKEIKSIIYPADFGYFPNDHASRFIVTELIPLMPSFNFQFVGSNFPHWMLALQMPNLQLNENVPEMAPYLSRAGIMVIPLKAGAGTRLKALEAFASKIPVVSTAIGVEGLDVKDGKEVLIAETPEDFVDACNRLVSDPRLYSILTKNAYNFAEAFFSYASLKNLIGSELNFL